jgi:hypothetical protein
MMRRDAEDDANRARQAAIAAGASRATGGDFALGIRNVANATRVRDTDQEKSIRFLWTAAEDFRKAVAAARRVANKPPLAPDGPRASVSEPPAIRAEIAGVLERFRLAYNARDLEAIRQVYPQVRKDLEKTFRNCKQVTLTFGPLDITPLQNGRVQVEMESTEGCQPSTGQRRLRDQVVTNKFQFERRGTSWIIVEQLVPL